MSGTACPALGVARSSRAMTRTMGGESQDESPPQLILIFAALITGAQRAMSASMRARNSRRRRRDRLHDLRRELLADVGRIERIDDLAGDPPR